MRFALAIACAALIPAACGSPETDVDADGDGTITMEEAAAKSREMVKPEPGQYRASVEMVDLQMPNAPEEVREMMRQAMSAGKQTSEFCLTKEDAEKGFAEAIRESQAQDDCTFERFDAEDGSIDALMVCEAPGRGTVRMEITGKGTPTSSQTRMVMNGEGPGGEPMTLTMTSEQERIGDCPT